MIMVCYLFSFFMYFIFVTLCIRMDSIVGYLKLIASC